MGTLARTVSLSVALVVATSLAIAPAKAATATPPCLSGFNQVIPVSITLAPGETIVFRRDASCAPLPLASELFGIRAVGAQTGASPATVGATEYSNDGSSWTAVVLQNLGWNPPLLVRYTAPANGATTDAFFVIAGAVGSGSAAGYLYSVTIATTSSAPDYSIWHQAIGRSSADAQCPNGYDPSWQSWPNGGQGGWTCVRDVPMYGR